MSHEEIATYTDRIRTAYGQIADRGQWVDLAELRPVVGGHRPHVDAALRHMACTQQAALAPRADQWRLGAHDHEAALRIGGEATHLVSIQ